MNKFEAEISLSDFIAPTFYLSVHHSRVQRQEPAHQINTEASVTVRQAQQQSHVLRRPRAAADDHHGAEVGVELAAGGRLAVRLSVHRCDHVAGCLLRLPPRTRLAVT